MNKRLLYIFVLFCTLTISNFASAQHYIGVKGGYGSGSVRFFPYEESSSVWGLYSGGFSWKYYSGEPYVGGIQADLEFMQKGYRVEKTYDALPDDTTTVYSRWVNSVQLPLIWQPHVELFHQKVRVFMNLGVVFSYNIDSRYEWSNSTNSLLEEGKYDLILVRDNRFGYGLCGGFGLNYVFGKFEFMVEGRYYYGYSDILKNTNKYEDNPLRSPLDNINISIGLFYRLGRKKDKDQQTLMVEDITEIN